MFKYKVFGAGDDVMVDIQTDDIYHVSDLYELMLNDDTNRYNRGYIINMETGEVLAHFTKIESDSAIHTTAYKTKYWD